MKMGVGDVCDLDDDNDGYTDDEDAFPLNPQEHLDTDGDGFGDAIDPDDDNDGVVDLNDAFPTDPTESNDYDGDGLGDSADPDDDNDGLSDIAEHSLGTDSLNPDSDYDTLPDGWEVERHRSPLVADYQITVLAYGYCLLIDGNVTCDQTDHYNDQGYGDVPPLGDVKRLFDGPCAVDQGGLKCWGYVPSEIPELLNVTDVTGTSAYGCAANGSITCWGADTTTAH